MTTEKAWQSDFRRLFTSDSPNERQEALRLRDRMRPTTLFKYRDLTEATRANNWDALQNDYVWLPSIDALNDPFDCGACLEWREIAKAYFADVQTRLWRGERMPPSRLYMYSEPLPDTSMIEPAQLERVANSMVRHVDQLAPALRELILREVLDRHAPMMRQESREILQSVQSAMNVVSFSESLGAPAMWAHYANDHKGYCVEYMVSEMSQALQDRLFPVLYSDARYNLNHVPKDLDQRERAGTLAALHNSANWAYEEEWRVVMPEGSYESRRLPMPKPSTIYVGAKMLQMDKVAFERLARDRGIGMREVEMGDMQYTMVPCDSFIYRP